MYLIYRNIGINTQHYGRLIVKKIAQLAISRTGFKPYKHVCSFLHKALITHIATNHHSGRQEVKMISWKALIAGLAAILIIGLVSQVAFLMTATWLTILKNKQEIGAQNLQILMYTAGFLFASISLIPGGYITAYISKIKTIVHCTIVGILTTIISLATSPGSEHATIKGLVFVVFGTGMVILGGILWKWRSGATNP